MRLLEIADAKPEEYYRASDQIRGALGQLREQLQQDIEAQQAEWFIPQKSTRTCGCHVNMLTKLASAQVPRVNMDGTEFNYNATHPNQVMKIHLGDLIPDLDDYAMNMHDASRGRLCLVHG